MDQLNAIGPAYGYFPNGAKTWLVVKPHVEAKAQELFGSAAVNITVEGRPYLGGAVGESGFVTRFVQQKVSGWVAEVMKLSQVTVAQPHAEFNEIQFLYYPFLMAKASERGKAKKAKEKKLTRD